MSATPAPRHFLDLDRFDGTTLRSILTSADALKAKRDHARPLAGKQVALIFEKPSTRTRVSFEVGVRQLGGEAVVLNASEMQLGRGETVADTARVLSRYVDAIMLRANSHRTLLELAEHATVPVINGLTDRSHPCQIMADVMTIEERKGAIEGRTVAWVGDGNNVANSFIHASVGLRFNLRMACPDGYRPDAAILDWARAHQGRVEIGSDPRTAVRGADAVVADTWISMGDRDIERKRRAFADFLVDDDLMRIADPGALFLHCLPAHRGEEVTDSVIDGPQSVVFDEAENRLHAQKAILAWCMAEAG
ncbi:ornithine carbamoyltransferase [Marinivivus vitaminiproducens]|uniref:ornithine carbamoyltransferase n=1 Tax=Marinivivus vitaminiproducens TaxID=3035935 RepID=UPI0027A94E09|nr:ornithine carbamoyltransferase [Geminicoccaceae bacterium SCSIO 64248]